MKQLYIILGIVGGSVVLVMGIGFFSGAGGGSSGQGSIGDALHEAGLAPDFALAAIDGQTITLSEYQGEKPVILDFWASWCPNCRRDMPKLSAWYSEYKDQVEIIGINLQESKGVVQKFIDKEGINFPVVLDPSGSVSRQYGVQYTNTHVLIDTEGNVVRIIPGDITEADITSLL